MQPMSQPESVENTEVPVETEVPSQEQRLLTVLYALEELLTKQTSLKFVFIRGAVYGLGTVIGATLLIREKPLVYSGRRSEYDFWRRYRGDTWRHS